MSEKKDDKKTLVEDHALKRLDKVQEEKQKPYVKQSHGINFQNIFMGVVFLIVLAVMLAGML